MKTIAIVLLLSVEVSQAQSKTDSTASIQSKQAKTTSTTPAETTEHAIARKKYESVKEQFAESKAAYEIQIQDDTRCQVFAELMHHPITSAEIEQHMVGCQYETRKARYVMERLGEVLAQIEIQLQDVDGCLKTYKDTIDKKIGDQTVREADRIKVCREEGLYPSPSK